MTKIVEVKKRKDSASYPKPALGTGYVEALNLWPDSEKKIPYRLIFQSASGTFQFLQDRTNENINTRFFINSIYEDNHYFASIDKRELDCVYGSPYTEARISEKDFQPLRRRTFSTWTENFAIEVITSRIQGGLNSVINRLRKFGALKKGWDSYEAKPIKWTTITRAINFVSRILFLAEDKSAIPIPFVAPLPDGGIHFEWKTFYKELIHSIPEKEKKGIEYLKVDKILGFEREEEGEVLNTDSIVNIVIDWFL